MKINKWIKVALAVTLLSIIATTSAYFVLHSPRYTLHKINQSLVDHDWETFSNYLDFDDTFASLLNSDDDNSVGSGLAKAMAGAMKETALAQLKSQVEDPKNDFGENTVLSSFSDSTKPKLEITKNGKITTVRVYSKHGLVNIPAYMELQMRSEGWKYVVIGINNGNIDHRKKIVDEALKNYYIIPPRKKIYQSATINFTSIHKDCAERFYGTCLQDLIMINRTLHNNTNKKIASIEYQICPFDNTDEEVCKATVDGNIEVDQTKAFGKTMGWAYNPFDKEKSTILKYDANQLLFLPTKLIFDNNDSIVVDELAYIVSDTQPSIEQLVKFMKENDMQYADSVSAWASEQ
jgi:hypothetical protein